MKISVPVIASVDVLVIGGTVRAIKTALALRAAGRSVFIATPYSYFGEDVCGTLDLFSTKLDDFVRLFDSAGVHSPAQIKAHLDKLVIDAGIDFLLQMRPVRPAYAKNGAVCGALFASRSGFHAVAAKVVIDATERSTFAREAGIATKPFVSGHHTVRTFVIGGVNEGNPKIYFKKLAEQFVKHDAWGAPSDIIEKPVKRLDVFEVWATPEFKSASAFEIARVGAEFRKSIWSGRAVAIADSLMLDLGDDVTDDFQPSAKMPVFIASRANADAGAVEQFVKTTHLTNDAVSFREKAIPKRGYNVVRADHAEYFRFKDKPQIPFELNSIPEVGACDVFVAGGGTGGAPAAIGAAREGASVICAENLPTLGGVMLVGRIGNYYYGNRVGFTTEIDEGHRDMAPNPDFDIKHGQMNVLWKHEWFLERGLEKGVRFLFDTMTAAAAMGGKSGKTAAGAVILGSEGIGVIKAPFVIDATGNTDFVAAAGAPTACDMRTEAAVQGAGLSPAEPGWNYTNTDYTFVLDSDVVDASRAFVASRGKFADKWFDVSTILNTRERRRIVGDVVLQPHDFFANRTWSDTINRAMSNFDTHGFVIHPMFMVRPTAHDGRFANVPLRALLPKGYEGMAATGLGVSAHRDCMPLIRMQPDVQNQGYAMGRAAARAVKASLPIRKIDFKALQRQLISENILEERALTEKDVPCAFLEDDKFHDISRVFIDPAAAIPELKAKLAKKPADYETAMTLAFLGDAAGRAALEKFLAKGWDEGWDYRGMGQFGMSISHQGAAVIALANIGLTPKGKTLLLKKIAALSIESEFSHIRAISLALMANPMKTAAPLLEKLLAAPAATGYAISDYKAALAANRNEHNDTSYRNSQLKEIYLAKALAACDAKSKTAAAILAAYKTGMQALFALFAGA